MGDNLNETNYFFTGVAGVVAAGVAAVSEKEIGITSMILSVEGL